jgi:prephenate dehydratase
VVASLSTVAAVEQMLASEQVAAAIAPRRASELYAVEVLTDGIQDQPHNVTRFIILARTDHPPTGDDKTSLCFAFSDNQPGRLHEVLGEFASRGLNLSKVESRPTKESLGHYTFLVDVEGHRQEKSLGEALSLVERQASIFKVFGSYPRWRE